MSTKLIYLLDSLYKIVIGNIVDPQGGGHTPDDDMHSKFNVGVSSGGNPAEGGEDPMEPSDAEETIASHEHT